MRNEIRQNCTMNAGNLTFVLTNVLNDDLKEFVNLNVFDESRSFRGDSLRDDKDIHRATMFKQNLQTKLKKIKRAIHWVRPQFWRI